jgi:hypothetical protein
MKRPKFVAALAALFGSTLPPEKLVALDAAMEEELATADSAEEVKAEDEELKAADASLSDEEKKEARDCAMKDMGKDSLTDEEEAEAYKRAAKDKRARDEAPKGPEGGAPKPAQDAAIAAAVAEATKDMIPRAEATKLAADAAAAARADALALVTAREAVAPKVGIVTLDSAEAVYRFALDAAKIPHKDVPASALPALYAATANLTIATDAAPPARVDVRDIFPGLSLIRRG